MASNEASKTKKPHASQYLKLDEHASSAILSHAKLWRLYNWVIALEYFSLMYYGVIYAIPWYRLKTQGFFLEAFLFGLFASAMSMVWLIFEGICKIFNIGGMGRKHWLVEMKQIDNGLLATKIRLTITIVDLIIRCALPVFFLGKVNEGVRISIAIMGIVICASKGIFGKLFAKIGLPKNFIDTALFDTLSALAHMVVISLVALWFNQVSWVCLALGASGAIIGLKLDRVLMQSGDNVLKVFDSVDHGTRVQSFAKIRANAPLEATAIMMDHTCEYAAGLSRRENVRVEKSQSRLQGVALSDDVVKGKEKGEKKIVRTVVGIDF